MNNFRKFLTEKCLIGCNLITVIMYKLDLNVADQYYFQYQKLCQKMVKNNTKKT